MSQTFRGKIENDTCLHHQMSRPYFNGEIASKMILTYAVLQSENPEYDNKLIQILCSDTTDPTPCNGGVDGTLFFGVTNFRHGYYEANCAQNDVPLSTDAHRNTISFKILIDGKVPIGLSYTLVCRCVQ